MAITSRKKLPIGFAHSRQRRSYQIPHIDVQSFKYGLKTYPEPQTIERGASPNSNNFLSKGDKVETRNGYALLGTRDNTANGKVTGLFTAHKWDGTEILFKAQGSKLFYYNESLTPPDWVEVGTNVLSGANGEDVSMAEYFSPAGAQLWVSSPNSDLLKIMTANPGNALSQYDSTKNFKGRIKIKSNRMFMWQFITGTVAKKSNANLALSYIDKQAYTDVAAEVIGTGDGTTKTFAATLAAITGKRTCFAIKAYNQDSIEVFTDNYLGVLTGSLGGTGTINYATGAISITFNSAPANLKQIKVDYSWEDSTNNGIADFTKASPRAAGNGAIFLQQDGGDLLNVMSFNNVEYCMHERKSWALTIGADDTTATNLIFRDNMSPGNWRGMVETAFGVFYVDVTRKSKPYFAVMEYSPVSQQVLPKDLSSIILDLANYSFDQSVSIEWDKYIATFARTTTPKSTKNNVLFLYNREMGIFDLCDFYGSCAAIYKGTLVAGDSVTNNVFTLFSGYDDDGAVPNYLWDSNIDEYDVLSLKKTKKLYIEGEIDINQSVNVYASIDRGTFVLIGTIKGSGSYVDKGQAVLIGSLVVGLNQIGGGSNGATAFHYLIEIKLKIDKFQDIQLRFQPQKIGYFSANRITHWDIRMKAEKIPIKYRTTAPSTGNIGVVTPPSTVKVASNFQRDSFTSTAGQTVFVATRAVVADFIVIVNGQVQNPTLDYTISGNTLTLSAGIPANLQVVWIYLI